METMKAAICTKYGPPEVLRIAQYQKPVPRDDEILIKICATSVTNSDLFIRSSKVALRLLIPFRIMIGITKTQKSDYWRSLFRHCDTSRFKNHAFSCG